MCYFNESRFSIKLLNIMELIIMKILQYAKAN